MAALASLQDFEADFASVDFDALEKSQQTPTPPAATPAPAPSALVPAAENDEPNSGARLPSTWSFSVFRDVTRFGFLKNNVTWTLILNFTPITVRYCHSTVGGKRSITVNNQVTQTSETTVRKSMVDLGVRTYFQFTITGMKYECFIQDIRTMGNDSFDYELYIPKSKSNGHVKFAEAREKWLQHEPW